VKSEIRNKESNPLERALKMQIRLQNPFYCHQESIKASLLFIWFWSISSNLAKFTSSPCVVCLIGYKPFVVYLPVVFEVFDSSL